MASVKKASVCIYFVGIGMAYKKTTDDVDRWHILFPFDDCHTLKFSYEPDGEAPVFYGHLAQQDVQIEIKSKNAQSSTASTSNFDNYVLDLTSKKYLPEKNYLTHKDLQPHENWKKKGVLLTIENAVFGVVNYLQSYKAADGFDIILEKSTNGSETSDRSEIVSQKGANGANGVPLELLAHMICANIDLGEEGSIDIKVNGKNILSTKPGTSYSLRFDNDCEKASSVSQNGNSSKSLFRGPETDMGMLYELISDVEEEARQFKIIGKKRENSLLKALNIPESDLQIGLPRASSELLRDLNLENLGGNQVSEPVKDTKAPEGTDDLPPMPMTTGEGHTPHIEAEKPCMFCQITNPGDLP